MTNFTLLFLLMCCVLCVHFLSVGVEARLPDVPSLETRDSRKHKQLGVPVHDRGQLQREISSSVLRNKFNRLPGVCQRLRRRRITILCNSNVGKYCSVKDGAQHGHICRCPRASKCKYFFLRSL
ncbi:cocaine- and amphetamine-regulated transcript protein [Oncorhynchus keta]|uniref:cocaine- and amphetamine-regulated transcript protein n=1 Tax=Oncorhynchus keta TaxID=8018 RepID=UPI0015FBE343|nr:cocaine- and amphetamine-regulated transcript protein [Oncorhynchus keta]